jgi:hypothetical protein
MKKLLILGLILASAVGCATSTSKTTQLHLGLSKSDVRAVLGAPDAARGAIRNKFNQVIEVFEYTLAAPSNDNVGTLTGKAAATVLTLGVGAASFRGERKTFWLYFLGDELVQWGQAGDWDQERRLIYDIQFNSAPKL